MIFITGDCHGNFERFNPSIFPEQKEMTKEDYVIICGDFGGVWHKDEESPEETMVLDWLDSRPFTTLFVCGNHENFDRLYQYPVEDWHGGKVHKIRDSVLHQSVIFCGQFIHAILFCSLLLRLLSFDFSLRIFLAQAGQYLDAPEPGTYSTPHTVQFLAGIAAHRFVGMICNSSTKPMNL